MSKKFFLSLLLFLVCFQLLARTASAHTLKYDGSIGAVLHVDPEDDPIIGEPANFFFEFKDKNGNFKPSNCSCLVAITRENQELFSQQLETSSEEPSLNSASFSFTFPEKGVYKLTLTGTPNGDSSFSDFKLIYDIRVARQGTASDGSSFIEQNLHFILLGIILLVLLTIYLSKRLRKGTPGSAVTSKILLLTILLTAALALHGLQIGQAFFFHHHPNHQEAAHPCCLPQPIAIITTDLATQPVIYSAETILTTPQTTALVTTSGISNRSPPVFAWL